MTASCDMRTCILVTIVLVCRLSVAAAAPLRGPRRMLAGTNSVVRAEKPQYYAASTPDTRIPLCVSQRGFAPAEGVQLTGSDAALAAWFRNTASPQDPNTMGNFESCSGQVSTDTASCWTGVDVNSDHYFVELICYTLPECQTLPGSNGTVTCMGRR